MDVEWIVIDARAERALSRVFPVFEGESLDGFLIEKGTRFSEYQKVERISANKIFLIDNEGTREVVQISERYIAASGYSLKPAGYGG